MARTSRQSKILELISLYEIETQDDLVSRLSSSNFEVTQATISRDIKELGLIKVISSQTGKYMYSLPKANQTPNKYIFILKESVISFNVVNNLVVVKTLRGVAESVCSILDGFNLQNVLGIVSGIDTVMIIFADSEKAEYCLNKLDSIINF